ncbi:hypothetical protein AAC387_Pa01g1968 [Persea americana]
MQRSFLTEKIHSDYSLLASSRGDSDFNLPIAQLLFSEGQGKVTCILVVIVERFSRMCDDDPFIAHNDIDNDAVAKGLGVGCLKTWRRLLLPFLKVGRKCGLRPITRVPLK